MLKKVIKVGIIGATLWGNRGAEAMICTTIGKIKKSFPNAKFIVFSYFPKIDRKLINKKRSNVIIADATPLALVIKHFPFAVFDRLLRLIGLRFPQKIMPISTRLLSELDVLIDVFGISFSDGREKFLPFNILSNWPAMLMKIPVVKLAQGLGTYKNSVNRFCAKWILGSCTKVFARGAYSFKYTSQLGIKENLDQASDIAFLYEPEYSLTDENNDYVKTVVKKLDELRNAKQKILTLSVSSVVNSKCENRGIDYTNIMAQISSHYIEKGYAIVLFPNATRASLDSSRNNDIPIIKNIAGMIDLQYRKSLVEIINDINSESLRKLLNKTDFLIASRFHAMIGGLALSKPTMVLGWGHKYREILDSFNITNWAFDYTNLSKDSLIEQIDSFIAQSGDIQKRIVENLPDVVKSAQHQFNWLESFITNITE